MASRFSVIVAALGLMFTGASLWTATPAADQTPAATNQPATAVTFSKDVLPIVQKNCQACHRPDQIGPFSMLTYTDARPWAKAIKAAVVSRQMPPWFADPRYGHFNNDRSLKQAEIDTISAWVDAGAPEGEPKDAPPPIVWPADGWQIQPDVTFDLPPYEVPATGIREWEGIAFPSPFKEDTWITSVEIKPGTPGVVHHMCAGFQRATGKTPYNVYEWTVVPRDEAGVTAARDGTRTPAEGTVITRAVGSNDETRRQGRPLVANLADFCYLPGLAYEDYRPVNAGVFVPAGSEITFNLHYTTNGLAVVDRSKIGFTVTKVPPAKKFVSQGGGEELVPPVGRRQSTLDLKIPPYEANYLGPPAMITFLKDVELVWFRPHAHVRARKVEYKLTYPDGREEILLNVPRYDFNWQLTYRTSVKVPKGSVMRVQFGYDNSRSNKFNPDPSQWVYYGGQSWEEMASPNMGFLVDRNTDENDIIKER